MPTRTRTTKLLLGPYGTKFVPQQTENIQMGTIMVRKNICSKSNRKVTEGTKNVRNESHQIKMAS